MGLNKRWTARWTAAACCTVLSLAALAAEPPTAPVLLIETRRHVDSIGAIATDTQNRWLTTVSDDKTLRLWDLKTDALLQTFRPPLDNGFEGKLYGVAMSPDGGGR